MSDEELNRQLEENMRSRAIGEMLQRLIRREKILKPYMSELCALLLVF